MSASGSPLSIVLPLKGRHLHTLRFFWHANRCRLPYHFIVADGQVHPAIARLLSDPSAAFPCVDIEYIQYPNDASFSDFFRKMADASKRVRTPYVMQVDNDDFLIPSGLEWCLKFLDANPSYASCGGGIGGFSLGASTVPQFGNVSGPLENVAFRYGPHYEPRDLSAPSAAQRLRDVGEKFGSLFYGVFRAASFDALMQESAEIAFSDLELHEAFLCMRAVTLGRARSEGSVFSYMRQKGTSLQSSYRGRDWVGHLLRSRFTDDFERTVARLADAVLEADGVGAHRDRNAARETCAEELREIYAEKLRIDLRARYRTIPSRGARHPANLIKNRLRKLSMEWLLRPYYEVANRYHAIRKGSVDIGRQRDIVLERLRAFGASDEYVTRFRRELNEIEYVANSAELIDFVRQQAPELIESGHTKKSAVVAESVHMQKQ